MHARLARAITALALVSCAEKTRAPAGAPTPPPSSTSSAFAVPGPAAAASDYDAIYFILVDRFANGDPTNDGDADRLDPNGFHGGDLRGVTQHLDQLKALGVRTIWLSPIFRMRTEKFFGHAAFHGYWALDLREVEPRFGTRGDLERLASELRRRGMRLMLDIVVNHVAPDSPWVRERPRWFHGMGGLTDWNDPKQVLDRDVHGLPDLDQENPEVYAYVRDSTVEWVRSLRLAGLRLDAVKHVPLSFWARFNDDVRRQAEPGFQLLGEVLDGDPALLSSVSREGRFDSLFDFPLYYALVDVYCRGASPARLGAVFSQDRAYDAPERLVTLLDNHDLPRFTTDCGGDLGRVRQALAFLLTARGTPALTYGIEAALEGAKDPDNRGDMRFDRQALAPDIRGLLAARMRHPALTRGVPVTLTADGSLFVYARVHDDEAVVIAVNRGALAQPVTLPAIFGDGTTVRDLLTDRLLDRSTLRVEAGGTSLFAIRAASGGAFAAMRMAAEAQWRRGSRRREVEIEIRSMGLAARAANLHVVGTGPELGAWSVPRSPTVPSTRRLRLSLPVGAVHEFKLAWLEGSRTQFEGGANRMVFVTDAPEPLRIVIDIRP